MNITKETCRNYARSEIAHLTDAVKAHYAWRYLHLIPIERKMGGFANFRHYFCNQIYLKEIEKLESIISAVELHGCLTGDCPHDTKNECYMELVNIPNLIEEMKK